MGKDYKFDDEDSFITKDKTGGYYYPANKDIKDIEHLIPEIRSKLPIDKLIDNEFTDCDADNMIKNFRHEPFLRDLMTKIPVRKSQQFISRLTEGMDGYIQYKTRKAYNTMFKAEISANMSKSLRNTISNSFLDTYSNLNFSASEKLTFVKLLSSLIHKNSTPEVFDKKYELLKRFIERTTPNLDKSAFELISRCTFDICKESYEVSKLDISRKSYEKTLIQMNEGKSSDKYVEKKKIHKKDSKEREYNYIDFVVEELDMYQESQERSRMIKNLRRLKENKSNNSTYNQLEDIFSEEEGIFLKEAAKTIDEKTSIFNRRILGTGTEIVVPFNINGRKKYLKASGNPLIILKGNAWLDIAKQNPLSELANARKEGLLTGTNYAGIITNGTENPLGTDELELVRHCSPIKNMIITALCQATGINPYNLLSDSTITNVYNTAINHHIIGPNINNKILATPLNKRIMNFSQLEERANNDSRNNLGEYEEYYQEALNQFDDTEDEGDQIIIHGDNGPRNVGPEQKNTVGYLLGRKIDFGTARLGYAAEDLTKLRTRDNSIYNPILKYFTKALEIIDTENQENLNPKKLQSHLINLARHYMNNRSENLDRRTNAESSLNLVRALSFDYLKNDTQKAKEHEAMIQADLQMKKYRVA